MSSVVAFVRALIMLTCLVAVPVLAITHGGAVKRARQAASRIWGELPAEQEAAMPGAGNVSKPTYDRLPSSANLVARAQRPATSAAPHPFPEPMDDPPQAMQALPERSPALHFPDDKSITREESSVADWQRRATILQQLGAVEYALEKWGDSGRLYRFSCLVAAAGTNSHRRHFEAVDEDGSRAVEDVVRQVRSWQSAASSVD